MKKLASGLLGLASAVLLAGGAHAASDNAATGSAPVPATRYDAQSSPPVHMIGIGIRVADVDRASRFFVEGLGMRELRRLATPDSDEVILGFEGAADGPTILLVHPKNAATPPTSWQDGDKIVLQVADLDATLAQLAKIGVAHEPVSRNEAHGVSVTFVTTPDGQHLEIFERRQN